jgi:hypothetical protein
MASMPGSTGGFPAHAVIVIGSVVALDDLADDIASDFRCDDIHANYHRVGGRPAHPTSYAE